MQILLAIDGSAAADKALGLVETASWPPETSVRVVVVHEPVQDRLAASWLGEAVVDWSSLEWEQARRLEELARASAARLVARNLAAEGVLLRGRAATEIVREAGEVDADLIVVGSRGQGPIETMLLGSVSAEVVDRAHCPVLVARTDQVRSVILAVDGSACAAAATRFVVDGGLFPDAALTVASVVHVEPPVVLGLDAAHASLSEWYVEAVDQAKRRHHEIALEVVARVREVGRTATSVVVEGDPASRLIAVARERGADLVVVGTRGTTGLRRLVVGSVARNVLVHSPSSVLISRGPTHGFPEARAAGGMATASDPRRS
jgi:nucleotide-binding universal stress UspA family protein